MMTVRNQNSEIPENIVCFTINIIGISERILHVFGFKM